MSATPDRSASFDAPLERFFTVLVETIRDTKPDYLRGPFTVAEIYQSLIPYRTHRDRLGVEMNGDYEDALLRLLAGEGDFLVLESEQARSHIQRELRRRNPNPGAYREFAAAEVRLNPAQVSSSAGGGSSAARDRKDRPETEPVQAAAAAAPSTTSAEPSKTSAAPSKTSPEPSKTSPEPSTTSAAPAPDAARASEPVALAGIRVVDGGRPTTCPACGEGLPDRESLQFCPFCGQNTRVVPCGTCGEELDRSWRFCVACGAPA